jgi:uncharacterized protein (UPF0261 family)
MQQLGTMMAERLGEARGPVRVMAPMRGFSLSGVEGGALFDPEGDRILIDTLEEQLRPDIELERFDTDVNDPTFAAAVAARLIQLLGATVDG